MTQTISIISEEPKTYHTIDIGARTIDFVDKLRISDEAKETLIDEAVKILSNCIVPGENDNITNIAIGYVQSGKTMSFTTLSALAADNGYRVIIYLTGTKMNLKDQTFSRLANDLNVKENFEYYRIFKDYNNIPVKEFMRIPHFLKSTETVLLFPILKHYKHINNLANLFADVNVASALGNRGVLIIDDEADQSSFNTYARENALNADEWGYEDQFSRTYASILNLRKCLPCHSYVQYTATPQAAFLINNADILSPKYHTVLTPGSDYTGGKFFFRNKEGMNLIIPIPEEEVYHRSRNPLNDVPQTLIEALQQFLISVSIKVFIQKRIGFLSMMIHADGLKVTNELFHAWVQKEMHFCLSILDSDNFDPARMMYLNDLRKSYEAITKYIADKPSFEEVLKHLKNAIIMTNVHLIQGEVVSGYEEESKNSVDWDDANAHILIGADMLNRGFTVEHLSMTYMCRSTKGKSNADTIEQRCRFYGYKRKYADICRVYLPEKSITEYQDYVEHEEIMRTNLKACSSLAQFTRQSKAMILAGSLNPTRSNILSEKLIRNKMVGWRQMGSIDCMKENLELVQSFISQLSGAFVLFHDYQNTTRNHRYVKLSVEDFIRFFKAFKFQDVPNITRKIVTIQYLYYLKEIKNIEYVYVIEMGYSAPPRKRKITEGKPEQLFMGYAKNQSYPGDKAIKFDDSICVQLHHLVADDVSVKFGNKDFYNLAIYYPEKEEYITFESNYDE